MNKITVGELKEIIKDAEDSMEVNLGVDTGEWFVRRPLSRAKIGKLPYSLKDKQYLLLYGDE